jgi:hypothetical protein
LQRRAGLFGDLELDRTAGLALNDCRAVSHVTANGDVIDLKANEIATPELAVDGEVEHRQIALVTIDLHSGANGPGLSRSQGRFCPTTRPLFHGAGEWFDLISVDIVSHRSALIRGLISASQRASLRRRFDDIVMQ